MPQVQVPLTHTFVGGAYVRTGWVPAGTLIVGHKLATAVPLVLLQGTACIVSDGVRHEVEAPWATVSEPGSRRLIYALTDCLCMNALATTATTVPELEAQVIQQENACLSQQQLPSLA